MGIVILGFLMLFSIISLNLASNNISTYAEETETNNIVIKDADLVVEEYISGLNLPVMIDFIDQYMLVIEKDEDYIKSLNCSLDDFIFHIKNKIPVDLKFFNTSLEVNKIIIDLKNK